MWGAGNSNTPRWAGNRLTQHKKKPRGLAGAKTPTEEREPYPRTLAPLAEESLPMKSSTPDTNDKALPGTTSGITTTEYPVHYVPAKGLLRKVWENFSKRVIPLKPGDKRPEIPGWQKRGVATPGEITGWEMTYGPRAGVGLLLGKGWFALDHDITTPLVHEVVGFADLCLGPTARRQGQAPKTLQLYRLVDDKGNPASYPSTNIQVDANDPTQRIQIMGTTANGESHSQIVIAGIHPKTNAAYAWTHDVFSPGGLDHIGVVTVEELRAFEQALRNQFERVSVPVSGTPAPPKPTSPVTVRIPPVFQHVPADLHEWGLDDQLICRLNEIESAQDKSAEVLGIADQLYQLRLQDEQILSLLTDSNHFSQAWIEDKHRRGNRHARADWLAKYVLAKAKTEFWVPPAAEDFDPVEDQLAAPEKVAKHNKRIEVRAVSARSLAGLAPPDRPWLIQDLIPRRVVTALYGPPGLGKTMAGVQACLSVAFGATWLGEPVLGGPGVAIGLFCEDDADEIHRRIDWTCKALGYDLAQMPADGDFLILDRSAEISNTWMEFQGEHGEGKATELFQAFRQFCEARRGKLKLIVMDVVADFFGGNENSRRHVNQFIKGPLALIAKEFDIAFIFLAHPSKAGQLDGSGHSGSTSWQGSVRSQLNLMPYHTDGDTSNKATLVADMARMVVVKSNYTDAKSSLRTDGLVLRRGMGGVLLRDTSMGAAITTAREAQAEALVREAVRELTTRGLAPSLSRFKPDQYIPAIAVKIGARTGTTISKDECRDMADRLVARGVLVEIKIGQRHGRKPIYGLGLADEMGGGTETGSPETDPDSPF
jgi:hypothetical protein